MCDRHELNHHEEKSSVHTDATREVKGLAGRKINAKSTSETEFLKGLARGDSL